MNIIMNNLPRFFLWTAIWFSWRIRASIAKLSSVATISPVERIRHLSFNESDSSTATTTTTTVDFLYKPASADTVLASTLSTTLETDLSTVLEYLLLTQYSEWVSRHNLQILRRTSLQQHNDTNSMLLMQCFLQHDPSLPSRDIQQALYQHTAAFSGRLPTDNITTHNAWPGALRQVPLTLTLQFASDETGVEAPTRDLLEEAVLQFLSTHHHNQTQSTKQWINVHLSVGRNDNNEQEPAQRQRFLRKRARRLNEIQLTGYGIIATGDSSGEDLSTITQQIIDSDKALLPSILQMVQTRMDGLQESAFLGLSQATLTFQTDNVETIVEVNAGLGSNDDEPVFVVGSDEADSGRGTDSSSIMPLILMIVAGLLILAAAAYLIMHHRRRKNDEQKMEKALEDHQHNGFERAYSDWNFSKSSVKEEVAPTIMVPLSPSPEKSYSPSKSLETASDSGSEDMWPEEVFADEDSELLANTQNGETEQIDPVPNRSGKKKKKEKKTKARKSKKEDIPTSDPESEDGSTEDILLDEDAELLTKKKKSEPVSKKKGKKRKDQKAAKKEEAGSPQEEYNAEVEDHLTPSEERFVDDPESSVSIEEGSSVSIEEVALEIEDPRGFRSDFERTDSVMSDISDEEDSPPSEAYKRTPRPGHHEFVHYPSNLLLSDSALMDSPQGSDLYHEDHTEDSGTHGVGQTTSRHPRLQEFVLPSSIPLDDATACSGVSERYMFRDDRSYDGSIISMESNLGLPKQDGKSGKDRTRTKKKRRGRKRDAKPPPGSEDGNLL